MNNPALERKPILVNKAFKQYLLASVLTVAATQIANIVDASIVGNLLGEESLAAVNLSKPLLQIFFSVTCLYVASSTILAGIAKGKGDRKKADNIFTFSCTFSLLLGILFAAAGYLCFGRLSNFLCQSESLRPLSDPFMKITLLSAVPQMIMLTLNQFVTMDGDPGLVSRAVVTGNVFNIILDIVFIKYFLWGISGAAIATVAMYVICILMMLPHFRKKDSTRLRFTKLSDIEFSKVLSIGLPMFLSTVLISVQYTGNNYVAERYLGDAGLIALAVCIQLFAFSMIILTGTLRTIQPVGAILRGMEDSKGMLMLIKRSYRFLYICFAVFAAVLIFFPTQISSILGVHDGPGLEMVKVALPLFTLHIVMQGLLCNMLPIFQFYNRQGLAMFLSIAQTLLPMIFFMLLKGNWIGFFIGQAVTALAILIWGFILCRKDSSLCRVFLIPMKDDTKVLDMTLRTKKQSMSEAVSELRSFLTANGKDVHTVLVASVCAEEFTVNIIRHGHATSIDLAATVTDGQVIISIHDDGVAFNPVEAAKAGEGRIGLGLSIAEHFCRDLDYKYIFNQNMLTFKVPDRQVS